MREGLSWEALVAQLSVWTRSVLAWEEVGRYPGKRLPGRGTFKNEGVSMEDAVRRKRERCSKGGPCSAVWGRLGCFAFLFLFLFYFCPDGSSCLDETDHSAAGVVSFQLYVLGDLGLEGGSILPTVRSLIEVGLRTGVYYLL